MSTYGLVVIASEQPAGGGALLKWNAATRLWNPLEAGAAGQPLLGGGAGTAPSYGTLGISYGGTGATTLAAAKAALGIIAQTVVTKSADYQVLTSDFATLFLVDTSGATRTMTLPAIASCPAGTVIGFKKISATNSMVLDGNASETIEGATTLTKTENNATIWLCSDGSGWRVMADNTAGAASTVTSFNGRTGSVSPETGDYDDVLTNLSALTGSLAWASTYGIQLTGAVADSGSNVACIINNSVALTGSTKLLSVRNNSVVKFEIEDDGVVSTGIWQATAIGDSYISSAATWNAKAGSGANSDITSMTALTTLTGPNGTLAIRTGTVAGNKIEFSAYDNDTGPGYQVLLTLTAGNSPSLVANGDLTVSGNLTVNGTTTTIHTETLTIDDNIIVLNSNETGTPSQDSGLEIERGTAANAFLKWIEASDLWCIDHGDSVNQEIVTRIGSALNGVQPTMITPAGAVPGRFWVVDTDYPTLQYVLLAA